MIKKCFNANVCVALHIQSIAWRKSRVVIKKHVYANVHSLTNILEGNYSLIACFVRIHDFSDFIAYFCQFVFLI